MFKAWFGTNVLAIFDLYGYFPKHEFEAHKYLKSLKHTDEFISKYVILSFKSIWVKDMF